MPFDSLSVTSPAIEMLREGRALIETHGLARGRIEDNEGRLCAVGGITRQDRAFTPAMKQAIDYLANAITAEPEAIAAWNDAPDRTQADVIAAYDRAIDLAVADQIGRSDHRHGRDRINE